ncbi:MAG: hypothetical protein HYX63_18035 [Gammaproteobacteria bacterium]|nr:hypothetical protein [Gammaproteobacteria bacterium]
MNQQPRNGCEHDVKPNSAIRSSLPAFSFVPPATEKLMSAVHSGFLDTRFLMEDDPALDVTMS